MHGGGFDYLVFASAKSGTTWTQSLLNAHPTVVCAESRAFGDYFDPTNLSGPHLTVEKFIAFLGAYYRAPVPASEKGAFNKRLLHRVLGAIADESRASSGKPIYGEKLTPYVGTALGAVRAMHEWNPAARFVHLVRDGRDVVVSAAAHNLNNRAKYAPQGPESAQAKEASAFLASSTLPDEMVRRYAAMWADASSAAFEAKRLFPNFLEIRYEEMWERPREHARAIFEFIGADASEAVVDRCVQASSFEAASGGRKPGEEDRGAFVRKGSPGDWSNWFTPEQLRVFQSIAGEQMARRGYTSGEPVVRVVSRTRREPA